MKRPIAIIILDWNGADDTIECLESLCLDSIYDIYVLDNGSTAVNNKKIFDYLSSGKYKGEYTDIKLQELKNITSRIVYIHSKENLGFAVGNNTVAKSLISDYEYIFLLNNDTVVPFNTIEHMYQTIVEKKATAITCDIRNYYHRTELWNAGGNFAFYGDRVYFSQRKIDRLKSKKVDFITADFITGCALLIASSYATKYGLFTDKFFHGEEDFNFCYRAKQNRSILGVDLTRTIYHKVGSSIRRVDSDNKTMNNMLVHYTNRTIDFKLLYSKRKWKLWRTLYLSLIFVKRAIGGMSLKVCSLLIKRIKTYSDLYNNVQSDVFNIIMRTEWPE